MKPNEVKTHLMNTRYDPVVISNSTLETLFAAIYGANKVTLFAPEGGQDIDIEGVLLTVVRHLLMTRWNAEAQQAELETQQEVHAASMDLLRGYPAPVSHVR